MIGQVTIVGLGLIGGSLGLALSHSNKVHRIIGLDIDMQTLQDAVALGAVHMATTSCRIAVSEADIVVLAVPVGQMPPMVTQMRPFLKAGCIITDVGSTKTKVHEEITKLLPSHVSFIGGHPMAGSERGGISEADPCLFENAIYCLTPDDKANIEKLNIIKQLVELVGSKVKVLSPQEHDLLVAGVSHLPHMVAVALVNAFTQIAEQHPDAGTLAAGGFRDTTRIAGGNPTMWRDISLSNRDNIVNMINLFQEKLDEIKNYLNNFNDKGLWDVFSQAQRVRQSIPMGLKGVLPGIYEMVVTVPDQPGMLSLITGKLGEAGINIAEIEILRVREGDEGTIRLAFQGEDLLNGAMEILRGQGFPIKRR